MAKIEKFPMHTGPRFRYDLGSRFLPLGWAGRPELSRSGLTVKAQGLQLKPEIIIETSEQMDESTWLPFGVHLMHDILKKAVSMEIPTALRVSGGRRQLHVGVSEPGYLVPVTAFILHRKHDGLRFSFTENANPYDGLWSGHTLVDEFIDLVPQRWEGKSPFRLLRWITGRPERSRAVVKIGQLKRENPVEGHGLRMADIGDKSQIGGQPTLV